MANDYSGNSKLCATCAYWAGQRGCNNFGTWVTNCSNEGRCAIPNGPIKTTMANTCACFSWKKWPVLK